MNSEVTGTVRCGFRLGSRLTSLDFSEVVARANAGSSAEVVDRPVATPAFGGPSRPDVVAAKPAAVLQYPQRRVRTGSVTPAAPGLHRSA